MSTPEINLVPLGDVAASTPNSFVDGPFGSEMKSDEYTDDGVRLIQLQNIGDGVWIDENKKFISAEKFETLKRHGAVPGDIAIAKMADPVARSCILPPVANQFIVVADCIKLTPDRSKYDAGFVSRAINSHNTRREAELKSSGTTRLRINLSALKTVHVWAPPLPEQSRIASVLDTVDEAIAKTEALTAKLKQVRAGLLHDLLTRGLDENGQLRDPIAHPEQFKDSLLGRIPRKWEVKPIAEMVASAVDGPFGSNLKTAHYINDHGVRVVRLQNIESGWFDNSDKAFISEEHALNLRRHEVTAGDLLVASMGDENHPLARACLYPAYLPPGIVKADCFRLRMKPTMEVNAFVMLLLNCPNTRREVNLLGQGVTRDRVNLTTLLTLRVLQPPIEEQEQIVGAIHALDNAIQKEESGHAKLALLKSGLMNDLLTGRVRVPEGIAVTG
jgi:type I restriction enzyme, S subunit